MEPGRRDGIDLQGFERNSPKHGVEIGGKERIEDLAQPVIIQGRPHKPRLEERQEPPFLQAGPDLIQGMMTVENREHQRLHPAAAGEHMRRMGRTQRIDERCHV